VVGFAPLSPGSASPAGPFIVFGSVPFQSFQFFFVKPASHPFNGLHVQLSFLFPPPHLFGIMTPLIHLNPLFYSSCGPSCSFLTNPTHLLFSADLYHVPVRTFLHSFPHRHPGSTASFSTVLNHLVQSLRVPPLNSSLGKPKQRSIPPPLSSPLSFLPARPPPNGSFL